MKTFKMPEPILTTTKEMSDIIPPGTKLFTQAALQQALQDILTEAIRRIEMLRLCWGDPAEESGMSRTIDILNDMSKENESSIIIEDEQ